jgi:hypothetical protein
MVRVAMVPTEGHLETIRDLGRALRGAPTLQEAAWTIYQEARAAQQSGISHQLALVDRARGENLGNDRYNAD